MELFNLEITRREKILNDKAEHLAKWEQEMADKVKECRKIEGLIFFLIFKKFNNQGLTFLKVKNFTKFFKALHRDVERSGTVRRKEFDKLKLETAQKESEMSEKLTRIMAQNARLKSENERLEKLQKETKQENIKLNEQIDEIMRNSKRKEGATWREINRLVDQVKMKYFGPEILTQNTKIF